VRRRRGAIRAVLTLALLSGSSAWPLRAAADALAAAPKTFRDCADVCPQMVVIPPGRFVMGSSAEERRQEGPPAAFASRETPQHEVTISRPFAMSATAITRSTYAVFVAETHRPDPPGCGVFDRETDTWPVQAGYSWRNPSFPQTENEPAACISWRDAHDFAAWLAKRTGEPYRLASEAEWEYAARAGATTIRYWGDPDEELCTHANVMSMGTVEALGWPKSWTDKTVCSSHHAFTQPVGSYAPNAFGLYDMIGNVMQWVSDCYHPTYKGAPTDGSSWDEPDCQQRMPRGGAFHSLPWLARAAFRGGPVPPDVHPVASGIRVVRDLP
jgi:sulfatase modifying factor 1